MKERIIIVFVAVVLGLVITTVGFFIYESAKSVPEKTSIPQTAQKKENTHATPEKKLFLTIDSPTDESVTDKRTIEVKGKTNPENIIVVSTNQDDVVAKPTSEGQFSVSVIIDAGTNKLITRSIAPTGDETTDERTVSFTTEEF